MFIEINSYMKTKIFGLNVLKNKKVNLWLTSLEKNLFLIQFTKKRLTLQVFLKDCDHRCQNTFSSGPEIAHIIKEFEPSNRTFPPSI